MVTIKSSKYIHRYVQLYYIVSEKSFATPDCLAPYLVNVATKEHCSICLETALISKGICVELLVVFVAAEE